MIRLLVGLGNPGPEYEGTRHNAGFWWLDAAARALRCPAGPERSYFGLVARVNRPDGPLWLLEPMTFMNLSGKSVAALARFFKIEPGEILVAHDELDLQPGQLKLKLGGSPAGHNGLKDIHAQLGTPDYWRLRLGIGHPGVKAEVVDYVLRKPGARRARGDREGHRPVAGRARPDAGRRHGTRDDEDPRQAAAAEAAPARARSAEGAAGRRQGAHTMKSLALAAGALMLCAGLGAAAQKVYRCGPDGRIYQQTPCAEGTGGRRRATRAPPSSAKQAQAAAQERCQGGARSSTAT